MFIKIDHNCKSADKVSLRMAHVRRAVGRIIVYPRRLINCLHLLQIYTFFSVHAILKIWNDMATRFTLQSSFD